VFDTVGEGNDTVTVNGQTKHVHGYLRDFLFPPERVNSPVKALSGGERNRLLLARLFTRPANVLVLDEPTNDLDIETLELLEAFLTEWPGTLLLVSHDRAFIDDVVTSTLVFEGNGRVQEFVGGYEDWLRQRAEPGSAVPVAVPAPSKPAIAAAAVAVAAKPAAAKTAAAKPVTASRKKLSYREQKELADLPSRIEALEAEQKRLNAAVTAPDFYKEAADTIKRSLARVDTLREELAKVYARWEDLESRAKA
jgi:ATP-binding cassette subfamily F protein uup